MSESQLGEQPQGSLRTSELSEPLLGVLPSALELNERDQLLLIRALVHQSQSAPRQSAAELEAIRRADALYSLSLAVTELRRRGDLAGDELPSAAQYRGLEKAIDLPLSLAQIIRAYGLWRFAKEAYAGQQVPPGRLAARLEAEIHRRQGSARHIAGLAEWLDSAPPLLTQEAYDVFARASNAGLSSGAPRLSLSRNLVETLRVRWSLALRVAHGEISLEDAQSKYKAEQADKSSGVFIGKDGVAAMLGVSKSAAFRSSRSGQIPKHVARVSGARLWRRADIEAYVASRGEPVQVEPLEDEMLGCDDLGERLGYSPKGVATRVRDRRWRLVPEPAGRVNHVYWWWRGEVEAWLEERTNLDPGS